MILGELQLRLVLGFGSKVVGLSELSSFYEEQLPAAALEDPIVGLENRTAAKISYNTL